MERPVKIVILGSGGTGKTCYVKMLVLGDFVKHYIATVGVEISRYQDIAIWDCAGQEKFKDLHEEYWKNSNGCIIMCDVTSYVTWIEAKKYHNAFSHLYPNVPIVMCCNKIDIERDKAISNKTVQRYCDRHNICYSELSVKENMNLEYPINCIRFGT